MYVLLAILSYIIEVYLFFKVDFCYEPKFVSLLVILQLLIVCLYIFLIIFLEHFGILSLSLFDYLLYKYVKSSKIKCN